ncbi:MAG: precorrin-2 C(20)-methyltransferase [Candidatus Bathyarchaeota archaeon]|nr:precorrin-2 C(20)-methyltransferase [Candidatus Bathyarchaeota archaeon]
MIGRLYGVGVGPGDPELITLKAYEVLRIVDVVCAPKARADRPSRALEVVRPILHDTGRIQEVTELIYPMIRDLSVLEAFWERNSESIVSKLREGKDVAFITMGDPMLYSTFIYTYRKVREKLPEAGIEVIPGVTSLTACAAASKLPIAEDDETVALIPSTAEMEKVKGLAKHADTLIFMKGVKNLWELSKALIECGFGESSIVVMVKGYGTTQENVKFGSLGELHRWDSEDTYLSTLMVKRCTV